MAHHSRTCEGMAQNKDIVVGCCESFLLDFFLCQKGEREQFNVIECCDQLLLFKAGSG